MSAPNDQPQAKRRHQWMMITFCHVEVLADGEGNPVVIVDPDKRAAAEQKATYGCFACNEPLEGNFGTECKGRVS